MATLKDVARDAGVSIATVSCCLSGSRSVRSETRMRIMDSIEKLKYIPNASARNLKKSASNSIGVVLADIDEAYHTEIFEGISSYLLKNGYTTNVAFTNNTAYMECSIIEEFISQNVSGLLIITSMPENTEFFKNRIRNYGIPVVFIERRPKDLDVSFVGFDNKKTAYYLTKSLLDSHYRRIALLTGSRSYTSESDSIEGYRAAFSESHVPFDPALIQETNMSKENSFQTVLANLDLDTLEAVITTSENIAYGALEAFHVQNISVPEDIRLLTFSEECWNHTSRIPGLVYTARTAFTLGSHAAKMLLDKINGKDENDTSFCMDDHILQTPLHFPRPARKYPFTLASDNPKAPLRILMVDLATSRSIRLLSRNFTAQTVIPVEIDLLPHTRLLKEIVADFEKPVHQYDIYMYDVPWLPFMAQNGLVTDISPYILGDSFPKSDIFAHNLDNCCQDGKYYGIPIISGSHMMFYRKDLFENHAIAKKYKKKFQISLRPPKTWTEFNTTAEFFTRSFHPDSPTTYGTSVAGIVDEELAPELLIRIYAQGGSLWDCYNRATLNTPETRQAFQNLLQTARYTERSPLDTSIADTVSDFSSGKTAMLVTYSEYASEVSKGMHQNIIGQVGYELLPGRTSLSIGWNLGISPYARHTDEALRYFSWLCRQDTSYYLTIMDGQSPVIAPYQNHELRKLYPWLELTEPSFSCARKRVGPSRPKALVLPAHRIEKILCSAFKEVLDGTHSMDESLEKWQEEMEYLFKAYGYPKPLHFLEENGYLI
ncbi:MAG: extracellular solute-binding protein [Lachnospiraceae bacterium]|nr:extracellular solute-binding protein [Lachnospiraceae bacterium]